MSHIETVSVKITDLNALKSACAVLGVEWVEGKRTYQWFGRSVGDYPVPEGFSAEDLGNCEHVIRVPGVDYEIGVVKCPDGPGYTCLYDFWGPGEGLLKKFGKGLTKLIDRYSVEALKAKARAKGYMSREAQLSNGKTQLIVTVP